MAITNPAGVPVYGPSAPYITPTMLVQAATGISWSTYPSREATAAEKYAAQLNLCTRATGMVDARLNCPARATVNVEQLVGPGSFEVQNTPAGVTRLLCSRLPVLSVIGGRMSAAAAFPQSWQTIAADQFRPASPVSGLYGSTAPGASGEGSQVVMLAPGWVTWAFGRESTLIEVSYLSGWPHASLPVAVAELATSLVVDDITGWDGAVGVLYDTFQEAVTVTAVTPTVTGAVAGPGTLTLSSGLSAPHDAGTLLSALPPNLQLASLYLAISQALTRGATATAVQSISGSSSGGGPQSTADYVKLAYDMIDNTYGRVI